MKFEFLAALLLRFWDVALWFPLFRRDVVLLSSRVKMCMKIAMDLLTLINEGTTSL